MSWHGAALADLVSVNSGDISANASFIDPDLSNGGMGLSVISAGSVVTKTYTYLYVQGDLVSTTGENGDEETKIFTSNSGNITASGAYSAVWHIDAHPSSLSTSACGTCITFLSNPKE